MNSFSFGTVASLISAPGAVQQLNNICRQLKIKRPFIVTDPGIEKSGLVAQAMYPLSQAGVNCECFTQVIADPPENIILQAVEMAKACAADGIIGLGGGSSLDTAKLVALLVNSDERLVDIYGVDNVQGQRLPLIMIPTTAGTGSEVTAVAIVTTGNTTKAGVVSPVLFADVALLDAELTLGLPPATTAMTGIDAMVHAIEAYTSKLKKNSYSDMLALHSLKLLSANLLTAFSDGTDIEARQQMLLGACLAGQAFANAPVAAVHALAYPLGGHFHLPHGLSNSLVLPEVLKFNATSAASLYADLADLIVPSKRGEGVDAQAKTARLIEYFIQLIDELALPNRLSEVGIKQSDLPMLAKDAMLQQRLLVNNPRELSERDALTIYQNSF
ncbi:iron-containing alcohol dehydrogenase [Halioxenophilus aromaticivorans]|uniref:Iron-containing alcohol dehydrogenase n=1 Tax=Halioxenophilus aromaticivorans TaxID=1306992 RepID=A0AAV3U2D0_9ALTE